MSLIYNATFDSQTRVLSLLDKAGNVISSCEVPSKDVDDITKPLTFRATQDGSTVKLTKYGSPTGDFQTSRDGGNTWVDYTIDTVITLNTGDEVSFRAKSDRTSAQSSGFFYFQMAGKIEAWHNVMSMIRTNDFATYKSVVDSAFRSLFEGCRSLTKAPAVPATTLAPHCYSRMFFSCSRLNEVHCQMPSSYSSGTISSVYTSNWLHGVSSTGTFYTNADADWPSGASGIPEGWRRVNEEAPDVDDPNKPLMLRAIEDNSSVTLQKNGTLSNTYQTSTNGTDWTDYTLGTKISLNKGESVYFRCRNHPTTQDTSNYVMFTMDGKIEAWHNAYSMISSSFTNTGASVGSYGMRGLFLNCESLTKAPLLLNDLSDFCYESMFSGCKSLTQAPSLPATILTIKCYRYMFQGCTSLTQSPSLPATILTESCYVGMFKDCTSLTQAPSLPATTLGFRCYSIMFKGCTSLKQAPELPAKTLAKECYFNMFNSCVSLTQAPSLPATTLEQYCYWEMFNGCKSLKEVRISATTTAGDSLHNWLEGVSATGDFYCDPNATIFPSGSVSGIPQNWTRKPLSDYPVTP